MLTRRTEPAFFFYWIAFFIAMPTICHLLSAKDKRNKKTKNLRAYPSPIPKLVSYNFVFVVVVFSLAPTTPHLKVGLPQIWFTQNKSFKMCVYLFVLVWGRCYELIIYKYYVHRYAYGIKYYKCKQMIKYSSYKYSTLPV